MSPLRHPNPDARPGPNSCGFIGTLSLGLVQPQSLLVGVLRNALSGTIPDFGINGKNLRALMLESNRLSGTLHPGLGQLRLLQFLGIGSGNRLSGSSSASFANWIGLKGLLLGGNKRLGWDLSLLRSCPELVWVALSVAEYYQGKGR